MVTDPRGDDRVFHVVIGAPVLAPHGVKEFRRALPIEVLMPSGADEPII